jgi:hypothetical protein
MRAGEAQQGSNRARMRIMKLVDEYKALSAESQQLESEVSVAEQTARVDIASSATKFSRSTREVLDDKLSFSATLMRAGEVDAAKRLLVEVTNDLTNQEVALVEQVNEVRLAQAVRRQRLTRARLLKGLIAAMLGSSIMLMSVMGLAVASMFDDDQPSVAALARREAVIRAASDKKQQQQVRVLTVAGVKLRLTDQEARLLRDLTTGRINAARLEKFLLAVDVDPSLVARVTAALTELSDAIAPATETIAGVVDRAEEETGTQAKAGTSDPREDKKHDEKNGSSGNGGNGSGGGSGGPEDPVSGATGNVLDGDTDPLS